MERRLMEILSCNIGWKGKRWGTNGGMEDFMDDEDSFEIVLRYFSCFSLIFASKWLLNFDILMYNFLLFK